MFGSYYYGSLIFGGSIMGGEMPLPFDPTYDGHYIPGTDSDGSINNAPVIDNGYYIEHFAGNGNIGECFMETDGSFVGHSVQTSILRNRQGVNSGKYTPKTISGGILLPAEMDE